MCDGISWPEQEYFNKCKKLVENKTVIILEEKEKLIDKLRE